MQFKERAETTSAVTPDPGLPPGTSERRSFPRYEFSGDAEVVWDETSSPVLTAEVRDISLGGCFLGTRKDVPLNSPVRLCLHLGGATIEIQGIVRRREAGVGIGIEFPAAVPLSD